MPDIWSREEVEATVSDYFAMLLLELRGEPYNKADHNRRLQALLHERTKGSIERKRQNISAILIESGYPYINGYKPLGNYQALLGNVVENQLFSATGLNTAALTAVESPIIAPPSVTDLLSVVVSKPHRLENEPLIYEKDRVPKNPVRRNYLELEARNQSLGLAGERFVLEFEHERLWRAGKKDLADRIEHVAVAKGDGLGYDIASFDVDGRERLIEVKTTRFGIQTPFFATRNEVDFSDSRRDAYYLYRLFSFVKQPQLFMLDGCLRDTCALDPIQFAASPR